MAIRFTKPKVVISNCLSGARCRWDGDSLAYPFMRSLRKYVSLIPVCPEIEIGLGVPRDRIILITGKSSPQLYQPSTHRQLAQKMNSFSHTFMDQHPDVDGFILKHKSPSCGLRGVKLYDSIGSDAGFVRQGTGIFAANVLAQLPHVAIEDEERLENSRIREHWLTKLFTLAAFRPVRKSNSLKRLQTFHTYYHTLLGTHSQKLTRELDRITHEVDSDRSMIIEQYGEQLHRTLAKPARLASLAKPYEAALEHYAEFLGANEKKRFGRQLEDCIERKTAIAELRKTVQVWAVRYDKTFTRQQALFRPYPNQTSLD